MEITSITLSPGNVETVETTFTNYDDSYIKQKLTEVENDVDDVQQDVVILQQDNVVLEEKISAVELHVTYIQESIEQDLSAYATKTYVVDYVNTYAAQPDLSAYVTKVELNNAGYISSIPSEYITDSELSACGYATQTYVTNAIAEIPAVDLSAYVTKVELNEAGYISSIPSDYATYQAISEMSYATQTYVTNAIAEIPAVDLSAYVTKIELNEAGYISSIPSEYITDSELSACGYATETYVTNAIAEIPAVDLSAYATKTYVSNSVASLIDGAPEGLNTLDKLAYAINDDPDFAYNISVLIDEKADTAYVYTKSEINELNTYTQGRINNLSATVGIIEVNFVSKLSLDQAGYATKTYVADYVATYGMPDLSSYATKSYVVDYVNTYAPQPDLSAYVTKVELNNASYATTSQLPVIDENIIPKTNETYTLGSSTYKYLSTYVRNTYTADIYAYPVNSIIIHGQDADAGTTYNSFYIKHNRFEPYDDNTANLGNQQYQWANTYTYNLILNGTDIKTLINNMFSYDSATGTLTITTLS